MDSLIGLMHLPQADDPLSSLASLILVMSFADDVLLLAAKCSGLALSLPNLFENTVEKGSVTYGLWLSLTAHSHQ